MDDDDPQMLIDIFRKTKFNSVRRAALHTLEDMAEGVPVKFLGQILSEEKDAEMRRMIVRVLGETESDDAVPFLEKVALEDTDRRVRLAAVDALEDIDTPKSRAALLRIIKK
jgi:HEAT repeat protein